MLVYKHVRKFIFNSPGTFFMEKLILNKFRSTGTLLEKQHNSQPDIFLRGLSYEMWTWKLSSNYFHSHILFFNTERNIFRKLVNFLHKTFFVWKENGYILFMSFWWMECLVTLVTQCRIKIVIRLRDLLRKKLFQPESKDIQVKYTKICFELKWLLEDYSSFYFQLTYDFQEFMTISLVWAW